MESITVLSLFDGMACARIALDRAGVPIRAYYASEIDKYAIKVAMSNYPDIIQLGDINSIKASDLPGIDLIIGGSPCFVAGTKIFAKHGFVAIENISRGDFVFTHRNQFKRVYAVGSTQEKTIELHIAGFCGITSTHNHPFYTREMNRTWDNDRRTYRRVFSDPKWKIAGDLQKGDFLAMPIIKEEVNIYGLTPDECFVLGRYIADGHTRKDFRVSDNRPNDRYWQLILSIGNKKYFDTELRHSLYPHTKNVERMVFNNKRLVQIAETECGIGSKEKKIGVNLLQLPTSLLKKVLDGIESGDGSVRNGENRITTISKELAQTIALAVAKVYKTGSSVLYSKRPPKTIIMGRVVNQNDTYQISYRKEVKKQSNFFVDDNHIWSRFKKLNELGGTQVFNLEVEDDNSYVADNCVVHNCQGFSFIGKQLNFDDPRSKLFFEFVRLCRTCKPKWFLLENVQMKQEYKDVISRILGVEPVMINSALVSAQNRKRLYWTNIPIAGLPADKGILLEDILETQTKIPDSRNLGELVYKPHKSQCLDANYWKGADNHGQRTGCIEVGHALLEGHDFLKRVYSGKGKCPTLTAVCGGNQERKIAVDASHWRKLTPVECERLQTVPDNYTSSASNTQRYRMLGNGFTVDVVAWILSFL